MNEGDRLAGPNVYKCLLSTTLPFPFMSTVESDMMTGGDAGKPAESAGSSNTIHPRQKNWGLEVDQTTSCCDDGSSTRSCRFCFDNDDSKDLCTPCKCSGE